MRVLVTRPVGEATRTAARLAAAGHVAILSPLIAIASTGAAIPTARVDAVLATSVNALHGVERLPGTLADVPWLVVGARLAGALSARHSGLAAHVSPDVADLVAAIAARYPAPARFLYLAGRDRKPALEYALALAGHEVVVVETYTAVTVETFAPEAVAALHARTVDAVLHFSRRTAALLVAAAQQAGLPLQGLHHIAISDDAAAPPLAQGWTVTIASAPNEDAVIAAVTQITKA